MLRLLRTIVHLRPRQIGWQLWYRLTKRLTAPPRPSPLPPAHHRPPAPAPPAFTFLNRTVQWPTVANIDWNHAALGKLWTYNLNYFEFLDDCDRDTGLALLHDWIDKAESHRDGWEPYPLSLRQVAWWHFLDREGLTDDCPRIRAALAWQYAELRRRLEFHLGGNHLLENALAGWLSANRLDDEAGRTYFRRLLQRELAEQYLTDGAHYELSAAYHLVLLDRQLRVYTLTGGPDWWADSLGRQLGWVAAFATTDGRYAHFNDSSPGVAPSVAAVFRRALEAGVRPVATELAASGYRRWHWAETDLWIDAAAIGPDYLPGHAHADNLTFVLHQDGVPVIVDPAVSTYEKNDRRRWERSTAAHNTVTVGGEDSSEVWGGFRVGRRARTTILGELPGQSLVARHDGYHPPHQRTFDLTEDGSLLLTDCISGPGVAHFHFDHRQVPELRDGLVHCGGLRLAFSTGMVRLNDYQQAVGWNELRPARCLTVAFTDTLVTHITTGSQG